MSKLAKSLPVVREYFDEFVIEPDGAVTAWACAALDLSLDTADSITRGRCVAPDGLCPRGLTQTFECGN